MSSRRSVLELMESTADLHKWSVPIINAADVEICRNPDGSPVELGRGGFCKVRWVFQQQGHAVCCCLSPPSSENSGW